MRSTQTLLTVFFLAGTSAAWAHSVTDELGVGTTQTTPINPRAGYLYNRIMGVMDLGDALSLRLDVVGTHDIATSPQHGAHFRFEGREIVSGTVGLDMYLSEHLSLSAEGHFSPRSSTSSDAPIPLGSTGLADAQINSSSSAYGFLGRVGYDTALEDSDFQTLVDATFSTVHYSSRQTVTAVETDTGPVDIQSLVDTCLITQQSGCDEYINAATQQRADLNQYRAGLSITEEIYNTDLSLSGAYYWYDHDPRALGYFSLATVGRTFATSAGLPSLAPLRYTLRPSLGHSVGATRLDLWYQYGQYVLGEGVSHGAGIRLQHKLGQAIAIWLRLDGQDDLDRRRNTTVSALVAIGLRGRF